MWETTTILGESRRLIQQSPSIEYTTMYNLYIEHIPVVAINSETNSINPVAAHFLYSGYTHHDVYSRWLPRPWYGPSPFRIYRPSLLFSRALDVMFSINFASAYPTMSLFVVNVRKCLIKLFVWNRENAVIWSCQWQNMIL